MNDFLLVIQYISRIVFSSVDTNHGNIDIYVGLESLLDMINEVKTIEFLLYL